MYIHTYICTIIASSGHVVVHLLAMHSMEHIMVPTCVHAAMLHCTTCAWSRMLYIRMCACAELWCIERLCHEVTCTCVHCALGT